MMSRMPWRHCLSRQPELLRDRCDGLLGETEVEAHAPAGEISRVDAAEHGVGIGDRRLGAAAAIAGRAGRCAGALRTDADVPALEPRERAAARTDHMDVDDRHLDRQPFEFAPRWTASDAPSTTRLASNEVPPMSMQMRFLRFSVFATASAPMFPPTGPERSVWIGCTRAPPRSSRRRSTA